MYVNYWIEFNQCKLICRFKTHYVNSARPSLTFHEMASERGSDALRTGKGKNGHKCRTSLDAGISTCE